jgi:inner membrane protein
MEENISNLEKMNHHMKNSVMLKLFTITMLILILLIPNSMVNSIIEERESSRVNTMMDVSSKWAGSQQINGPILTIPLTFEEIRNDKLHRFTKNYHVLPNQLNIEGEIVPKKLKRGIYEVVVYSSSFQVSGAFEKFNTIEFENLVKINYDQAFLTIGISDLRGIKNQLEVSWDKSKLAVDPGSNIPKIIQSGVSVGLPDIKGGQSKKIPFEFKLALQGSQSVHFIPLGKTTHVQLNSNWSSPKFSGNFLPDSRTISDKGFKATWDILQLNRNISQTWLGNVAPHSLSKESFGVDLFSPLDDYQKSMRSSKYAVLTISLTFLIFFLVEILNKRRIHPFQYGLVGLALSLFYVLLVSISEHTNFNFAYAVASTGIILMIGFYSVSVFRLKKLSVILSCTLAAIYGFVFITLQLEDYALLMGSIGLTVILGLTMYFTRNINWYQIAKDKE